MKGGKEQRDSTGAASGKEVGGRATLLCILSEEELKRFMLWNDGPSLAIELSDEDIEAMYQEWLRKERDDGSFNICREASSGR
jgi:hypothetical protein